MSDKRGVIELSDDNFDDVVFSNQDPVLVEFWSEGSYACRELDGVIDRLAQEYSGKTQRIFVLFYMFASPLHIRNVLSCFLIPHSMRY